MLPSAAKKHVSRFKGRKICKCSPAREKHVPGFKRGENTYPASSAGKTRTRLQAREKHVPGFKRGKNTYPASSAGKTCIRLQARGKQVPGFKRGKNTYPASSAGKTRTRLQARGKHVSGAKCWCQAREDTCNIYPRENL